MTRSSQSFHITFALSSHARPNTVRARKVAAMLHITAYLLMALLLAGALPAGAVAQPASRRLSFAELATTVMQNNLQLRAAALDVAVAQAQLAQARAAKQPQVGVTASYTRTQQASAQTITFPNPFGASPPEISITLPAPNPNIFAARLAVQYPLYTGGRLESQVALAEANLRGAQAVFAQAQRQVLFNAQQLYLQALLGQENVTAAQRALNQANESLRVANARVSAGAAPQFDVLQAQVAVANAEQEVVRARTSVATAQTSLSATLNLAQDSALEFTETLEPRPVAGTLQDAIGRAVRDRPELAEIQSRIAATQASIDLAASGGRPNVNVSTGYDVGNSNGMSTSISGGWSVTLGVTLALYDGGLTRERIREAELRLEQLKLLDAQVRQQVELDVRLAWLALQQAAGELSAATKAVEQGREAARLAAVRYQAGVGTQLELVSAQTALAQAELGLAAARFNQNLARIRLILAMGSSGGTI
jgi:outer membrane protein